MNFIYNPPLVLESFATKEDAFAWMYDDLDSQDEHCTDNSRFAFCDDEAEIANYESIRDTGCCGYYDSMVMVGGRKAVVGCNYGH